MKQLLVLGLQFAESFRWKENGEEPLNERRCEFTFLDFYPGVQRGPAGNWGRILGGDDKTRPTSVHHMVPRRLRWTPPSAKAFRLPPIEHAQWLDRVWVLPLLGSRGRICDGSRLQNQVLVARAPLFPCLSSWRLATALRATHLQEAETSVT